MSLIIRARRHTLRGEPIVEFDAWEPSRTRDNPDAPIHTTIMSDEAHGVIGRVTTRYGTDAAYDAMPFGDDRAAEVVARQGRIDAEAIAAVLDAYPWLADCGSVDGGTVWCSAADFDENDR